MTYPFTLHNHTKLLKNMTSQDIIKVAIIEDLVDIANELRDLFNEEVDMRCTQVYHNAEDAITFLTKFPADVVLCDIGLPNADGIQAIYQIKSACPQSQFCMFTVFEDIVKIFDSIKAGAQGYILKNSDPDTIVKSVRELHHGGSPMNPEIARKVIDSFAKAPINTTPTQKLPLTDRELQLLELLSQGMLYKEIGEALGITTGTVKQHIHKIYEKLQVNNRTEAINLYHKK